MHQPLRKTEDHKSQLRRNRGYEMLGGQTPEPGGRPPDLKEGFILARVAGRRPSGAGPGLQSWANQWPPALTERFAGDDSYFEANAGD